MNRDMLHRLQIISDCLERRSKMWTSREHLRRIVTEAGEPQPSIRTIHRDLDFLEYRCCWPLERGKGKPGVRVNWESLGGLAKNVVTRPWKTIPMSSSRQEPEPASLPRLSEDMSLRGVLDLTLAKTSSWMASKGLHQSGFDTQSVGVTFYACYLFEHILNRTVDILTSQDPGKSWILTVDSNSGAPEEQLLLLKESNKAITTELKLHYPECLRSHPVLDEQDEKLMEVLLQIRSSFLALVASPMNLIRDYTSMAEFAARLNQLCRSNYMKSVAAFEPLSKGMVA